MIPEWMKEVSADPPCNVEKAKKVKKSFVSKTIDGVLNFFQETIRSEGFYKLDGLLQSLDPRVKLISIFALIFAVSLVKDIRLLVIVYVLTLIFASFSKIEIGFFIKRVWLFIPIFTGLIVLPMIFNIFLPGDMLFKIADIGKNAHIGPIGLPESIYMTKQGVMTAAVFTLRVATCVSAVVLLFLTTRQDALFKSLRSIGVPKVYVLTLDMCYRYIFVFMDIVHDMHIAKKSRTIKKSSTFEEQKWVGGRIGYTMIKSLDMSERVHKAMTSRGFNGDVKILQDYKLKPRDYVAGLSTIFFSILLVLISQNILKI
jgi:cobalt/nickel transport system permease protein